MQLVRVLRTGLIVGRRAPGVATSRTRPRVVGRRPGLLPAATATAVATAGTTTAAATETALARDTRDLGRGAAQRRADLVDLDLP